MIEFPREGSSHRSYQNILSQGLKEDYARKVGIPLEEASFFINALGAVMQERLLQGLPCGIPFVCTLYLKYQMFRRFHVSGLSKKGPGIRDRSLKEITHKLFAKVAIYIPKRLKHFIRDSVPYTGDIKYHYEKENLRKEDQTLVHNKIKKELGRSGRRCLNRRSLERQSHTKITDTEFKLVREERGRKNGKPRKKRNNSGRPIKCRVPKKRERCNRKNV